MDAVTIISVIIGATVVGFALYHLVRQILDRR